jgi:hypothetical protein
MGCETEISQQVPDIQNRYIWIVVMSYRTLPAQ